MEAFRRRLLMKSAAGGGLPVGTTFDFPYTGTVLEITLPKGVYLLECWGAQGGNASKSSTTNSGGKGGYSKGVLVLDSKKTLYVFVGGRGTDGQENDVSRTCINGGWNGGGGAERWIADSYYRSAGGGATDISVVSSDMSYVNYATNRSQESLLGRFIVAGGGSGTSIGIGNINGSDGGGVTGGGMFCGGTQSSAGPNAGFGYGAYDEVGYGAGGGGWYGGGVSNNYGVSNLGGGSGFVNIASNAQYRPSGYTGLELKSGETIAGNTSFPSVTGGTETGHSGNGYARITVISGS